MDSRVNGRVLVLAVVTLLSVGCSVLPTSRPERARLTNGQELVDVIRRDSLVILFFDPRDCFQCDFGTAKWIRWGIDHPRRFGVVLTSEPTPLEQAEIGRLHLPVRGILANGIHNVIVRRATKHRVVLFSNLKASVSEHLGPAAVRGPVSVAIVSIR